jgi:hypothetical protein
VPDLFEGEGGKTMKMELIATSKLKIHPKNRKYFDDIRKTNPELWKDVVENVRAMGVLLPLRVNAKTMHVISGNQRLMAAVEVGIEKLPCLLVEPTDERQEEMELISSNIYHRADPSPLQLFEMVKVLREEWPPKKAGRKRDGEGESVITITDSKKTPLHRIAESIKKDPKFISAADIYNNLPKEAQKELRQYVKDNPTADDKEIIAEVKRLKDVEEKLKEATKKQETDAETITILRDEKKTATEALTALRAEKKEDHKIELAVAAFKEVEKGVTTLATDMSFFMKKLDAIKEGSKVGGVDVRIVEGQLRVLLTQIQKLYERFGMKTSQRANTVEEHRRIVGDR